MLADLALAPLGIRIDYLGMAFIGVSFVSWLLPLTVLELLAQSHLRVFTQPRSGTTFQKEKGSGEPFLVTSIF